MKNQWTGSYTVSGITYDKNGNIETLNRTGYLGSSFGAIDQLSYSYYGNQLQAVQDAVEADYGFKDGANTTTEYTYDANGNMLSDANKGITSIAYNHLNLPKSVTISNAEHNGTIAYLYDASGIKMKKTVNYNTTEYTGSTVYKNGALEFIHTPEGYMEPIADGYRYVYRLTDHLGNTRVSFVKNEVSKGIEALETNDFYPFGLQHGKANAQAGSSNLGQNYKLNGVELEISTGLYEMPLRLYDPALGRFTSIDPVTHHSVSPYAAFDNNPVFWSDPSGGTPACNTCGEAKDLFGRDRYDKWGNYIPPHERADTNEDGFSNSFEQKKEQKKNQKKPNHPDKIDFSKDDGTILEAVIAWARYIRKNNEEKIYLADIVQVNKKNRTLMDMFSDIGGATKDDNDITIYDTEGNSLNLGYFKSYLVANNFSDHSISDVWVRGRLGGSNRYEIKFITNPISNGNPPTIFYLNFTGESFYERIKDRILNPQQIELQIIDGKQSAKFNSN